MFTLDASCFDYLKARIREALEEVTARRREEAELFAPEALEALETFCRDRLIQTEEQAVGQLIREKSMKDPGFMLRIFQGQEEKMILECTAEVREELLRDGGETLYARFPVLREKEEIILADWKAAAGEFMTHLARARQEISRQLFGGRPIGRVTGLRLGAGDIHRHGRMVIGVSTDAGRCYYKPRDCTLDAAWRELTERWFSDATCAPVVVTGEGFGFHSELVHAGVETEEDIDRFYRHFGMLAALFQALGTTDMHCQNFISCGTKPCAVDLETVLGQEDGQEEDPILSFPPTGDIMNSPARSKLLPELVSHNLLLSALYVETEENAGLPRLRGKPVTVEGREKVFIAGYREGYARILAHREEMEEVFRPCREAAVRMIPLNSIYFSELIRMLNRPGNLVSPEKQGEALRMLRDVNDYQGAGTEEAILRYNAQCILRGEIPYFCVRAAGRDLCGGDPGEVLIRDYYALSPLEGAERRLKKMSEKNRRFGEDYIRERLRQAPLRDPKPREARRIPGERLPAAAAEQELGKLLRLLEETEVHHTDGSVSWISETDQEETLTTGYVQYSWSGVGWLCGRILQTPCLAGLHEKARELGGACLEGFDRFRFHLRGREKAAGAFGPGLNRGMGGYIAALEALRRGGMEGAEELLAFFSEPARQLSLNPHGSPEILLKSGNPWNIMNGTAGLALALDYLEEEQDPAVFARLGEQLTGGIRTEKTDAWYGAAGIGTALACCGERTGEERFLRGAAEAFGHAASRLGEEEKKGKDPSAGKAGGLYACASLALRRSEIPEARELLRAAEGIMKGQDTLCATDRLTEGNAMTALAYLAGPGDGAEACGRILSAMWEEKKECGFFRTRGAGMKPCFDPSVFFGTAGVGIVLTEYCRALGRQKQER